MQRSPLDSTKYLTAEETARLLSHTKAHAVLDASEGRRGGVIAWAVVDTLIHTGVRVGELVKLCCDDIDFHASCLWVQTEKRKENRRDSVAISKDLRHHLRKFLEWKKINNEPLGRAPLFAGKRGGLSVRGVQHLWARALARAELPHRKAHAARHTCAVRLLAACQNMRVVQLQLRHARMATTEVYADVTHEDRLAAVDKV